jgi:MFS family permease
MATAPAPEQRTDTGYELTVVLLLGLAFGFAFFDRQALTYLGPFVQEGLKLSNEQLGWANSGLSATWALGAFLVGRWSDAIGLRKPFLIGALVLFSACSVLSGFAWSFGTLLASRIVMGLAEGPFLPICLSIIAAASATSRRGLNSGLVQNTFGSIIGNALAPFVLVRIAVAYGWQDAFFIAGIPGLILAFLIWRFIKEPPPVESEGPAARSSLMALLAVRNMWLCALMSCFAVGSIVIGAIFMPLYLAARAAYDPLTWGNVMTWVGFSPAPAACW